MYIVNREIDKVVAIMETQSALAKALGVSDNAVSKWVAKGCIPPGRVAQVYALVSERIASEKNLNHFAVSLHSLLMESSQKFRENKHDDKL